MNTENQITKTHDFDDEPIEDDQPDSVAECAATLARRQAAAAILEVLTSGATQKTAGARAFCLSHLLKLRTCKTQAELGAKLHLSPGRISQVINTLRRGLTA